MIMFKAKFDSQNAMREDERKVDKEEIKTTVKEETAAIKSKVTELEIKVNRFEQADQDNKLKFDDMASKFGLLQKELIDMKQNQNGTKFPELPVRREEPNILPSSHYSNPVIHSEGRVEGEAHPTSQEQIKIFHIIKKAKKTIGLSPISEDTIEEAMEELRTTNIKLALGSVVKEFLMFEMSIPQEVFDGLTIQDIFKQPGEEGPECKKLFIELEEENMVKTVYRYARKMNRGCRVHNFIPNVFRERANQLEHLAYQLRHSYPAYNTKIRWGTGDLILERKPKGDQMAKYKPVTIQNSSLPPVDLQAGPRVWLPTSSLLQLLAGRVGRRDPGALAPLPPQTCTSPADRQTLLRTPLLARSSWLPSRPPLPPRPPDQILASFRPRTSGTTGAPPLALRPTAPSSPVIARITPSSRPPTWIFSKL